ncbi:hypothetical protein BASA81_003113 [Batrachochytrium salamandrivorans]|nr:hypothetical protein BASA81_003113 [Batrachochytrium salamandrivorans]
MDQLLAQAVDAQTNKLKPGLSARFLSALDLAQTDSEISALLTVLSASHPSYEFGLCTNSTTTATSTKLCGWLRSQLKEKKSDLALLCLRVLGLIQPLGEKLVRLLQKTVGNASLHSALVVELARETLLANNHALVPTERDKQVDKKSRGKLRVSWPDVAAPPSLSSSSSSSSSGVTAEPKQSAYGGWGLEKIKFIPNRDSLRETEEVAEEAGKQIAPSEAITPEQGMTSVVAEVVPVEELVSDPCTAVEEEEDDEDYSPPPWSAVGLGEMEQVTPPPPTTLDLPPNQSSLAVPSSMADAKEQKQKKPLWGKKEHAVVRLVVKKPSQKRRLNDSEGDRGSGKADWMKIAQRNFQASLRGTNPVVAEVRAPTPPLHYVHHPPPPPVQFPHPPPPNLPPRQQQSHYPPPPPYQTPNPAASRPYLPYSQPGPPQPHYHRAPSQHYAPPPPHSFQSAGQSPRPMFHQPPPVNYAQPQQRPTPPPQQPPYQQQQYSYPQQQPYAQQRPPPPNGALYYGSSQQHYPQAPRPQYPRRY